MSGLDLSRLSPGLQEDIGKLAGSPLDRQQLRELAARLEAEQPRYVAAVRVTADPDGSARVVFVVARMRDAEPQPDINTKYIVEDVEIRGVPDSEITPEMRADLQALTGKTLDSDVAERLETTAEVRLHQLQRRPPDEPREPARPDQGGLPADADRRVAMAAVRADGGERPLSLGSGLGRQAAARRSSGDDFLVLPHFAIDVGDELIEEYSGFGVRFESRKLGTERLGVFFEWSTFDQTWRDPTLAALAASIRECRRSIATA